MTGTSIKTILAIALLVGAASQATADTWDHIDQQAVEIQRATKKLRQATDHYRQAPHYGKLLGYTARLKAHATAARNISIHSHSLTALRNEVRLLDRVFHDAATAFDQAERDAAYGKGYIRGNTRHVKQLLVCIEDAIQYLQKDIELLTRTVQRPVYTAPARPVYGKSYDRGYRGKSPYGRSGYKRSYNPYGSGVGISIGGGSSRISFRF